LAALALERYIPESLFDKSLLGLEQLSNAGKFIGLLLTSSSNNAVRKVLKLYGSIAERPDLIALLKHPDSDIRAQVVAELSTANDVAVIKILSDSYKDEADATVRAVYEDKVAVIKERT
jgi:hypothetical protein